MILHIFNDQIKFSKGYFEMLNDNAISLHDMELVHYGKKNDCFKEMRLKATFIGNFFNPFSNFKLVKPMFQADKIIVHSLASPYVLLLIALFPSIAQKINWVIWGKDLYFYQMLKRPKFYHKIYESLRKSAIKKIPQICSIFEEDYNLACDWYGTKATNLEMITLYPYALGDIENVSIKVEKDTTKKKKVILLGNSASKTNNHIEVLELLSGCKDDVEKIICPLSYGGSNRYVNAVIAYGENLFGEKFMPLCDFMPKNQYFKLLDSVDIGVFNYNRQEGLGNIWSLMLAGKTIYMKHDTSTTSFFARNGIVVKDIASVENNGIELLSEQIIEKNIELLRPMISVDMSVCKWKQVLEV